MIPEFTNVKFPVAFAEKVRDGLRWLFRIR